MDMDVIRSETVLEEGYKITNECLSRIFREKDADENCTNPGIKMLVEKCNNMDTFMELLKDCHYDGVPDNLYDILLGKSPDWQLCTVTVSGLHFIFDFVNPKLDNQKRELTKADKDDAAISMPESDGFAMLALNDLPRDFSMKLRFEAVTPIGGISNTTVAIESQKATVTKYLSSGYRVYEMMDKCDFLGQRGEGVRAILTEYLL